MAIMSSLVTAKGKIDDLNITVPSTINADNINVNAKAKALKNEMVNLYKEIGSDFATLGVLFKDASSNFTGTKTKKAINKMGNQCSEQGRFCDSRRDDLNEAFTMARSEQAEATIEELTQRIAALENQNNAK